MQMVTSKPHGPAATIKTIVAVTTPSSTPKSRKTRQSWIADFTLATQMNWWENRTEQHDH